MTIAPSGFSGARKSYRAFLLALIMAVAASPVYASSSGFSSLSDTTPFSGTPSGTNTPVTVFTTTASTLSTSFAGPVLLTGWLGIGTTSPDTPLHIDDIINNTAIDMTYQNGAYHHQIGIISSATANQNEMYFKVSSSGSNTVQVMTLQGDGSVGIGTGSPTAKLHIYGADANVSNSSANLFTATDTNLSDYIAIDNGAGANDFRLVSGSHNIELQTATNSYQLVLNTSGQSYFDAGYVGIGTTQPDSYLNVVENVWQGNAALHITVPTVNAYAIMINDTVGGTISPNNGKGFGLWQADTGQGGIDIDKVHVISFTSGNGTSGNWGGYVGIGMINPAYPLDVTGTARVTTLIQSSDLRMKSDIHPIAGALDKILALHGVEFNWKKDGRPDMGVIAQDVAKVFPDIVKQEPGKDGMMAVEYTALIGPMIESIRELKTENDAIKANNDVMKAQLIQMNDEIKSLKENQLHSIKADKQDGVVKPSTVMEH